MKVRSYQMEVDTTNFDNNLSASADTAQKALDALDDLIASGGGSSTGSIGVGTNFYESLTGDGSTSSFTIAVTDLTTTHSLVSINGVIQRPVYDYSISGTNLSFTGAPFASSVIEVRGYGSSTGGTELSAFSETEILTERRWVDGKPIYRKVIDFGALPNATEKTVSPSISSLDMYVNIYGIAKQSSQTIVIPRSNSLSAVNIDIDINSSGDVRITSGYDASSLSAYVVLDYTKTTDTLSSPVNLVGGSSTVDMLTENTTVNLNNTMTSTEIQALINAQPKNLGGFDLTFQFADGTYSIGTLTGNAFTVQGFYAGRIFVLGNVTESATTLHTNQAVIISATITNYTLFNFYNNTATIIMRNIRMNLTATTNSSYGVTLNNCNGYVYGCYVNYDQTFGRGITARDNSGGIFGYNYITRSDAAIFATSGGIVTSIGNDDTVSVPSNGLYAQGGIIMKTGTQPTGTTNENTADGGVIR